jgi:hypothetical protein
MPAAIATSRNVKAITDEASRMAASLEHFAARRNRLASAKMRLGKTSWSSGTAFVRTPAATAGAGVRSKTVTAF